MKAIILAAGKGTRFASEKTKVLHCIAGKPLVLHVVEKAKMLGVQQPIVVLGYQGEAVREALQHVPGVQFAWQREQLGTGHAVLMALPLLGGDEDEVLILYGDVPCLALATLQHLRIVHETAKNTLTLLTAVLDNPKWYGRIIKDNKKQLLAIREAKDANAEELRITEINSGIMLVQSSFLRTALLHLVSKNKQGEYYLTDIVEIAVREGRQVGTVLVDDPREIQGVNSLEELEEAQGIVAQQIGEAA
ncbi:MAG: NTP transferase domain-containing protein [Nanoarchaeota archaeon]|nr:NTP transferase domain-containing protein [Nanoarchaeota archaeon]